MSPKSAFFGSWDFDHPRLVGLWPWMSNMKVLYYEHLRWEYDEPPKIKTHVLATIYIIHYYTTCFFTSLMWVIQCHKPPIWEWYTYHLFMVIWGMVYPCFAKLDHQFEFIFSINHYDQILHDPIIYYYIPLNSHSTMFLVVRTSCFHWMIIVFPFYSHHPEICIMWWKKQWNIP